MAEEAIGVRNWEWPDLVRDHHARVISDRKWPLKKRQVIAHIKARSKYYFLTINRNNLKNTNNSKADLSLPPAVCAVSLSAFLLPPVGRCITSPCFADGANGWSSAMGGMSLARCDL
jgi:hypothetical protein